VQKKSLQQMMPDAWRLFFHHRQPRPLQATAIPSLLRGESILLSGPTASGKTEAVVAPLFQRHVSFRRNQLAVVYVAPTKALVNDLFYRLETYLGITTSGTIRRYTGDHHEYGSPEGGFLLLATPEALDSLQLVYPEKLADIRAVIVDEIHLLHGNARGQQLRHVINRIEKSNHRPQHPKDIFQKVGMTATIDDLDEVSALWLGKSAIPIAIREQREIDLSLLDLNLIHKDQKAQKAAEVIHSWLELKKPRKAIVFGNSRNGTQAVAASLFNSLQGTRWPVHWHTGILSKEERERIEEAMKSDQYGICVATSTLEVGIDIGDIDVVILYDPPHSVVSFLQRIGRGNRKTDKCQVAALCCSENEKVLIQALYECARKGVLDDIHEFDRPSVRFQQILSFAWRGVSRDRVPLRLGSLAAATCDDRNEEVMSDMLDTGTLRVIGDALLPSDHFMDLGEKRLIHSVIAGGGKIQVTDGLTGKTLIAVPSGPIGAGMMFVGGTVKQLTANSTGEMILERTGRQSGRLVQLPAMKGRRWLSRKVVWEIAVLSGESPQCWKYSDNQIVTWGGEYNRFLALLIKINVAVPHGNIKADEYSINSLYHLPRITPEEVAEWVDAFEESPNISMQEALPFCTKSRFYQYLGRELQRREAIQSIPIRGFRKWLDECCVKEEIS
jgi:ATP-dependent Lhr-like helicase